MIWSWRKFFSIMSFVYMIWNTVYIGEFDKKKILFK